MPFPFRRFRPAHHRRTADGARAAHTARVWAELVEELPEEDLHGDPCGAPEQRGDLPHHRGRDAAAYRETAEIIARAAARIARGR
ncbi:hypothetical protein V1L54_14315 [Streptomyces sp. TRM 70361]|uniref:hypothetical protein n=1 Tax=Streptomyces sp. TRM 70361 TaxID=3116553 RepID=UPI002E7BDB74|nr:hypothetical protein [Streptomyces sp. TRM 70361]MEE1940567.1 hypothetical protein [Streptomyces sp. TRM 70361]